MSREVFDGPYPKFFTDSALVFPEWDWSDGREPTFYALVRTLPRNTSLNEFGRYDSLVQYGGSEGGRHKWRGTSFRELTHGSWVVYGFSHPELGNVIHDADLMACARELSPSQVEQLAKEDESLRYFFQKAKETVDRASH